MHTIHQNFWHFLSECRPGIFVLRLLKCRLCHFDCRNESNFFVFTVGRRQEERQSRCSGQKISGFDDIFMSSGFHHCPIAYSGRNTCNTSSHCHRCFQRPAAIRILLFVQRLRRLSAPPAATGLDHPSDSACPLRCSGAVDDSVQRPG